MSEDLLVQINDSKNRPMITVRSNGMTSFYRYPDLLPSEKESIVKFFESLKKDEVILQGSEGTDIQNIAAYLDYSVDEDFCG